MNLRAWLILVNAGAFVAMALTIWGQHLALRECSLATETAAVESQERGADAALAAANEVIQYHEQNRAPLDRVERRLADICLRPGPADSAVPNTQPVDGRPHAGTDHREK